jgi:pentatricopeptide repeat protein
MAPPVRRFARFGSFDFDLADLLLYREGEVQPAPPKAMELLAALLREPGGLLGKRELLDDVWGGAIVEEGNLSQTVFVLRRMLGESPEQRYIETIPRRGYRFVAPVEWRDRRAEAEPPPGAGLDDAAAAPEPAPCPPSADGAQRRPIGRVVARRWAVAGGAGALLAVALLLAMVSDPAPADSARGIESVLVLPLQNVGGDPEQQYLCEGLTEELIGAVGRIEGLRVPGRATSFAFGGGGADYAEIHRRLGLASALEGSLQRVGDRIRVRVRLVRLPSGFQLWSASYERPAAELFALHGEVAEALARELRGSAPASLDAPVATSDSPAAGDVYSLLLQARYFANQRSAAGLRRALERYERALALDPENARGWAGLSDVHRAFEGYGLVSAAVANPRAEAAALRAIELDPAVPDAHVVLAMIYEYTGRAAAAARALDRELELQPRSPRAHLQKGLSLSVEGRFDEAIRSARQATALDPLWHVAHVELGGILAAARRFDEALAELEEAHALAPAGYDNADNKLAWLLSDLGRAEEAVELARGHVARLAEYPVQERRWRGALAYALAKAGRVEEAREVLDELERLLDADPAADPAWQHLIQARVAAAVEQPDRAVDHLEKALAAGYPLGRGVLQSAEWDPVRHDSRFGRFERELERKE